MPSPHWLPMMQCGPVGDSRRIWPFTKRTAAIRSLAPTETSSCRAGCAPRCHLSAVQAPPERPDGLRRTLPAETAADAL
jgi:hypothetical protein